MEKQDKVFADGFIFKRSDNAPEWVIGNISIKSVDAVRFIENNSKNGWVNLKINKSQSGKTYIELDTWERPKQGSVGDFDPKYIAITNAKSYSKEQLQNSDDLPF